MKYRERGSRAALRAFASVYAASKHVLVGLTQNVALFHNPAVSAPTPSRPAARPRKIKALKRSELAVSLVGPTRHARMPFMTTADRTAAIMWLLSEDAANVSGVVLHGDAVD